MSIFNLTSPTIDFTFTTDEAQRFETAFKEVLNAVEEAKANLEKATRVAKSVGGYTSFRLERADEGDIAEAFWKATLRSLPVYRVMSEQDRDTVIKWVGSHEYRSRGSYPRWFPPFTVDEIMQVAEKYESRHASFLRNWALSVYRNFVGYPETPQEVTTPKNVTAHSFLTHDGVKYGYHSRQMADMDRLFHYLDGRPFDESNHYDTPLVAAIRDAKSHDYNQGETEYFKFRLYSGNGNIRLTFKRRDLVAQWESLARQGLVERMNNIY